MGSRGSYLPQGGFSTPFEYESYEKIDGVKVLRKKDGRIKMPEYSNTSEAYIIRDKKNQLKQLRIFENRAPKYDVDLDHLHHHNKDSEHDQYHIHVYESVPGSRYPRRPDQSGKMTPEDSLKWGHFIERLVKQRDNGE